MVLSYSSPNWLEHTLEGMPKTLTLQEDFPTSNPCPHSYPELLLPVFKSFSTYAFAWTHNLITLFATNIYCTVDTYF